MLASRKLLIFGLGFLVGAAGVHRLKRQPAGAAVSDPVYLAVNRMQDLDWRQAACSRKYNFIVYQGRPYHGQPTE